MNPGRELDALVAEKVMKWKKIEGTMYQSWGLILGTKEMSITSVMVMLAPDGDTRKEVPHYSTNISAAWEVVEKLKDVSYSNPKDANEIKYRTWPYFNLEYFKSENPWKAVFCGPIPSNHGGQYIATGESAAQAICLAALKSVGYHE